MRRSGRCAIEAAIGPHLGVQRLLAGMAERRVAEIVGERHGFGEILVEAQGAAIVRAICATSSEWVSRVR